jgi:hypothetical protein
MRIHELYHDNKADFDQRYTAPVDDLETTLLERIGDGLGGDEATAVLEEHMRACEQQMCDILQAHSRLFWVHLSGRVPPVPQYEATAWTTALYRLVFTLALLKHGRPHDAVDDMTIDDNGTFVPRALTHEDHLAINQVEQLAISFNFAAASYRRAGKGAVLRIEDDGGYSAAADDELEGLIESIDARVGRYSEVLSPFGSTAETKLRDPDSGDAYRVLMVALLNVFQAALPDEILQLFGLGPDPLGGKSNYLIGSLSIHELELVVHAFEEQIRKRTGLTSEELLGFLWALSWRNYLLMLRQSRAAFQFLQSGYVLTTEGDRFDRTVGELADLYRLWLRNAHAREIDEAEADEIVRRAFDALAYTGGELDGIDLWSKSPRKPILRDGEYTLWDYSAIGHYFRSLFEEIGGLTGVVGNVKGENFEDELLAEVEARDDLTVWEVRRQLKADDGSSREVDVSFVAGDTLYLAECKAFSAHPQLDRGEVEVLARRWEKLCESLDQADSLREFLLEHPSGTNYALPEQVKQIRALVCTPMPEYIPTRDADFWFDEDIPRVCVPAELLELAASIAAAAVP